MRKVVKCMFVFLLVILSGCSDKNKSIDNTGEIDFHTSNIEEESQYCKLILDEVIRCLDEDDTEGLKLMFSEYSATTYDLDMDITEAFTAYEGESVLLDVFSYDRDSYHVDKVIEKTNGKRMGVM